MQQYLVGGYYDNRVFMGVKEKTLFSKDINIYTIESALKLGFVEQVVEWYEDTKKVDDIAWHNLDDAQKVELILKYTENNALAGLLVFDNLQDATNYVKTTLLEILNIEKESQFVGTIENNNGNFNEVYVRPEKNLCNILQRA